MVLTTIREGFDNKKEESKGSSIFFWFNILTLVYFVIQYFNAKNDNESGDSAGQKTTMIWSAIYYLLIGIIMFQQNYSIMAKRCGKADYLTVFLATLFPWTLIFGIINIILVTMPGWKAPFSNTFGYLFAMIAGVGPLTMQLFKGQMLKNLDTQQENTLTAEQKTSIEAVSHIYNDPTLIINEVTPENFDNFWDSMITGNLFNKDLGGETGVQGPCDSLEDCKKRFRSIIVMKDLVATFIWYWLAGNFTISQTSSYIQGSQCAVSAQDMLKMEEIYKNRKKNKEAQDAVNNAVEGGKTSSPGGTVVGTI
tara:strand:- start:1151 stop:2077 length:927 start_codon:yes stop_codon:yes gene_type:complete